MTVQDAVNLIAEILRADVKLSESKCSFVISRPSGGDDRIIEKHLELDIIEKIFGRLKGKSEPGKNTHNETALWDDFEYEVLVREESRRPTSTFHLKTSMPVLKDQESGLTYVFGVASDEYFLFLLQKIKSIGPLRMLSQPPLAIRDRIVKSDATADNALDVAKGLLGPRMMTLRISSTKSRTVAEFEKFADAYFFQLSYNFDQAILPQRYLDELLRLGRLTRLRRASPDELEPPKRTYIPDLIHHYQLAIASENPALEFLSYYHVMEHFFEDIFRDALIEDIRRLITQPDFSYRRNKDIVRLIKKVSDKQKSDGDDVRFSEQDALELTLTKFVEPRSLLSEIREYDDSLVAYYRKEKVEFCDGDLVNLELTDSRQIIKSLTKRIYKTRNALVHSKDGAKGKYVPFKDDKLLIREVPLMRFIAEIIIVESSRVMA